MEPTVQRPGGRKAGRAAKSRASGVVLNGNCTATTTTKRNPHRYRTADALSLRID
jgi:hypothetical protein